MNKTNKKYLIFTIAVVLLLCVGVSLAYWTGKITGKGTPITLTTQDVRIIFSDSPSLEASKIIPGWSYSKTFTVTSESTNDFKYNIVIKDLVNTFKTEGYLQYKITCTNGYNMTEWVDIPKSDTPTDTVLAYNVNIPGEVTQEYTIEFRYLDDPMINQSEDKGSTLSGTMAIVEGTYDPKTLYGKILADHQTVLTRTTFDEALGDSTATTGVIYKENIYKEDETTNVNNNRDVYYFAGNVADNWVSFGGYYWRIIRTNEDGSIRLLYHSTSTTATDSYIETGYAYNPTSGQYNNTIGVGFMFGTTGSIGNNRGYTNSPQIKTKLEEWYGSNLASNANAISKTAIYCNDRAGGEYASSGTMYYAAYNRLSNNLRPTYKCGGQPSASNNKNTLYGDANVADRFSVSDKSGGNGKLSQPIGLMTADEVAFAGGVLNTNAPITYYYLNSSGGSSTGSYWWWTMSPFDFYSSNARVFSVIGSSYPGNLSFAHVSNTISSGAAVRPVISLKSCVEVSSGNGTANDPYTVKVSETCSLAEN